MQNAIALKIDIRIQLIHGKQQTPMNHQKRIRSMQKVIELLKQQGKQVENDQIAAVLARFELDGNSLSDAEAKRVVAELLPNAKPLGEITVANTAVPTTPQQRRRGRPPGKKENFAEGVTRLAQLTVQEVDAVTVELRKGSQAWKQQTKEEWRSIVRNIPDEAMEEFLTEALEEAADVDSFRQAAESAVKTIFPLRDSSIS